MNNRVDKIVFGCGGFGGFGSFSEALGKGNDERLAHWHLDHAYDLGIRYFDTANTYANGLSETMLGHWMKSKSGSVRSEVKISSKVGNVFGQVSEKRTLNADHIKAQIEGSLKRLGIEALDIYFTHVQDKNTPLEETVGALTELKEEGKIHAIGAANVEVDHVLQYSKLARLDYIQNMYNLLHLSAEKNGLLDCCNENRVKFWAFSPLCGGILSGKYEKNSPPPSDSRMELIGNVYEDYLNAGYEKLPKLKKKAREEGLSLTTYSYRWLVDQPKVSGIIVGPKTKAQWEDLEKVFK